MRERAKSFYVVFAIAASLIVPGAIALRTIVHPAILQATSDNPTPLGYTWSLALFIIPIVVLAWWFGCRPNLKFPRKAFWRTIAVLAPLCFALDLLFGNAFFIFANKAATLGCFPWYFIYLIGAPLVPSAGFFCTAQRFINWRAFSLTFFLLLLMSLLWEMTLALPYGWWEYRSNILIGLRIGAWSGLPIEAVCVWLALSFTTVITYEVIKIWKALGTRALEAFFGIGK